MEKEGISKRDLKLIMKKFGKNLYKLEGNYFEYNIKTGCVLLAKRHFMTTPTEMLLAKCAYCQAIKHETTECPDTWCPLYKYMFEKKRYIR
jgi:hypothetical protein